MFRFRFITKKRISLSWRFADRLRSSSRSAPSCITFLNFASGFAAFLAAWSGVFSLAAYFLLVAILCDALDGAVARRFGLESRLGKELDSLADAVSFCIVPAFILLLMNEKPAWYVVVAAFLYCWCGIFRLARFNVSSASYSSRFFTGVPTTLAAFIIALMLLPHGFVFLLRKDQSLFMSIVLLCLALAMVSHIKIPRNVPVFARLLFLTVALLAPQYAFVIFWGALVCSILFSVITYRKRNQVIKYVLR